MVVAAMVDDEGGENGSVDGAASRGDEVAPVEGGAAANVDAAVSACAFYLGVVNFGTILGNWECC